MRRNAHDAPQTKYPSPTFSKTAREWILSSALYDGIEDEDLRQIQTLLAEKGANPNVLLPEYGISPFHLVVANENINFAVQATDICLQHGADPNVRSEDGLTPVQLAAMWGCTEVLHVLLASGGNPWLVDCFNKNAFDYAKIEDQHECYEVLTSYCNSKPKPTSQLKSPYQLNLKRVVVYKNDLQIIYDASPTISKRCVSTQTSPNTQLEEEQGLLRNLSENKNCNKFSVQSMPSNKKSENNIKHKHQGHKESNGEPYEMQANNVNGHDDTILSTKLKDLIIKHRRSTSIFEHSPVRTDGDSVSSGVVSWKDFNDSGEQSGVVSELVNQLERTNKIRQSLKSNVCDNNMFKNITHRKKSSQSGSGSPNLNSFVSASNEPAKNDIGFICSSISSQLPFESLGDFSQNKNSGLHDSISNDVIESSITTNNIGSPPSIGFILDNVDETEHATRNSSLFSDIGSDVEACTAARQNGHSHDVLMTEDDSSQEKLLLETRLSSSESPILYVSCEDENTRGRDSSEVYQSCVEKEEMVYAYQQESEHSKCEQSEVTGINSLMDSVLNLVDSEDGRTPKNNQVVTSTPDKNSSESEEASFVSAADKISEVLKPESKEAKVVESDEDLYISISEEYEYTDLDEGVVLLERHYLVDNHSKSVNDHDEPFTKRAVSSGTTEDSEVSTISGSERAYDTDDLRRTLQEHGFTAGPINGNTKRLYLRKLKRFRKKPQDTPKPGQPAYSPELLKTLGASCEHLLFDWAHLEESMSVSFTCSRNRPWREGSAKTSFTYLLLDPRLAHNLSACAIDTPYFQQWPKFLQAIFYIGKGKRSRPYNHLYDAVEIWNKKQDNYSKSKKIQRILDIWQSGDGVICLHVFFNVIPVEAFTREAAMISALTLTHLTNEKTGEFYGSASCWNLRQKCRLGCVLLHRAFRVFLAEGERQLRPADID